MLSNKENLLSICCLGYNHGKFAADNLKAIWNSDYKDIEIIVVDDGSKDDSRKILSDLAKDSPFPIKLILQENTGNIGRNFNNAIKEAHGEFISFIALDDMLISEKISMCIELLKKDKKLGFVAPTVILPVDENGNTKLDAIKEGTLSQKENVTLETLLEMEYDEFGSFYIQGVFFRKEIIDAVGGFDEDIIGDDIVLRTKVFNYMIKQKEYTFKLLSEPTCRYRRHSNNISACGVRQVQIVSEYLAKYWADREVPDVMIEWLAYVIKSQKIDDVFACLGKNLYIAKLLNNKTIQKCLIKRIKKETSLWRYIYKKEKDGNLRIATFFSFMKIKYKRR